MVVGALTRSRDAFLNTMRLVASAGTIYAAFPGVMLLAAVCGYVVAKPRVRRWTLALCLAAFLASVAFTIRNSLFPARPSLRIRRSTCWQPPV